MKKTLIVALAALFCMQLCGCGLFFEKHSISVPDADSLGDSKIFTGDGYSITLTDMFTEKKSQVGFDGYYVSEFCGVMVQIVTPSKAAEYNIENLKDLLTETIEDNGGDPGREVTEDGGLTYYRYSRNGNAGWNFAFKGAENYYLVQFVCLETNASELENTICTFAKSVIVE